MDIFVAFSSLNWHVRTLKYVISIVFTGNSFLKKVDEERMQTLHSVTNKETTPKEFSLVISRRDNLIPSLKN